MHEGIRFWGRGDPATGPTLRGSAPVDLRGDAAADAHARRLDTKELYPEDLLLSRPYKEDPLRGLVFLHAIGIGYMLLGLNTVCDVYFTGALEEMVQKWKIKPDVAGATFMAAGGSAPEFFTSLIGTTITMNDVGFSTIIGSAVFNVLFVIGLCGYVAKEAIELSWWPLFRDCTYYILGLSLLAGFASNGSVALWEAIVLFSAYIIYCIIMYHNERLEELANNTGSAKVAPDVSVRDTAQGPTAQNIGNKGDWEVKDVNKDDLGDPEATPEKETSDAPSTRATPEPAPGGAAEAEDKPGSAKGEGTAADDDEARVSVGSGEADSEDDDGHFMDKPEGTVDLIMYYMSLPIYVPLYYLTPEATHQGEWPYPVPKFVFCFLASLAWIAGFSVFLVWWVEILGDVILPGGVQVEVIMGFTVLAAGTSIPDAVSSMAVARNGEGDMAVSSSIGSNIFDILIGLPIPIMAGIIKTGVMDDGPMEVKIDSPYIAFYVILLLSMVFATIVSIHVNGWLLNKALGVSMAVLYVIFLTIALTVEFTKPTALQF